MTTIEAVLFFDGVENDVLYVTKTVTTNDGQVWKIGTTENVVDWAVPVGFPDNSSPVCREIDPQGFEELNQLEH